MQRGRRQLDERDKPQLDFGPVFADREFGVADAGGDGGGECNLYRFPEFSVYSLLGFMPTYWSILVYNQSGAAFDLTAANFYAKHSLVSYA